MKSVKYSVYSLFICFVIFTVLFSPSRVSASENIIVANESFEHGTYAGTNYLPIQGTITRDPQKVVNGKYSTLLSSLQSDVWKEFNYTDSNQVKFEKNTTYQVTFSYKSIDMQPLDSNRFFYFLARSTDGQEDKGFTSWNDASGNTGIRTMTFTTGNKENYYLIWGIHAGGSLAIDDIQIVKAISTQSETFEKGTYNQTDFLPGSGHITSDPNQNVSGQYSAFLSSARSEDWKEFSYTDAQKVKFEKNTTYQVTFSYRSVDMGPVDSNRYFYFLARSTDNTQDKGWTTWNDANGTRGSRTVTFTTANKENYYLIWGIHSGGALSIDDIEITKVSESFEKGTFTDTQFTAGSGVITKDPEKVISGQYSAYLASQQNEEWKTILTTDPNTYRFEKNTTYTVTFSYKPMDMDPMNNGRYFYFLARSMDDQEDKGWTTWNEGSGITKRKSVTFTTGNKDNYYLIWGIRGGGAISLDDITIHKDSESLERGTYSGTDYIPASGILTNDPAKVVNGMYSAYLNSPQTIEWANLMVSDSSRLKFQKNTTYTVSFAYKSIDMEPENSNRHFYFLARGMDNVEVLNWTSWNEGSGSRGVKTVTFTTGEQDNYYLTWGVRNGGAISIDDIIVRQLTTYRYDSSGRLMQVRTPDNSVVRYSYDRNGNMVKTIVD
ncbi:RHS repeat domain-containing protein [Paenibacillus silagei]|uniref:YD repeat-containing protein n=1 Tax=Paenibacillus silagei TaxID=1670801 RepID=A0ABS4NY31_9BACL|nr:RHS repeat domain-containing protein [Paenibacillus silagei]MBP2114947.1 YD repeat-containing protein [Paenibacillus silagei]